MRFIHPMQAAVRPRLACEFAPDGILAGGSPGLDSPLDRAVFVPLPGGVSEGLSSPVFRDRGQALSALKSAIDDLDASGSDWTVVVPDACVRVHLLDFDTLPAKSQEVLPLVRFRLRRMVPFDADSAAVSYQLLKATAAGNGDGGVRVIAAAMPVEIREEFESLLREQGLEPGVLLPAALAALAAMPETGSHLMVHTDVGSMTTAITREGDLLLYRRTEISDGGPEEMAKAVLVAAAYYEDTLHTPLTEIWVAGQETPESIRAQLEVDGTWQIPLHSLVDSQSFAATAVPATVAPGRFAGVVGALRG